ncbi:MAG: succinylglutamate desuccinylase/aspartoacylase family protein [Patescibacteria group bacterium]|jgi:hypothetical protein
MLRVNLGDAIVRIPVHEIRGQRPGKTLLITGGMDGDEYAGIEAGYQLAEKYRNGQFEGRLIIIPIVNIPGFEGECSQNPLDGKFPKYIFPGKADGSSTERLMHWLSSNYISQADVWHDLHAGAITEGLRPFVSLYQTGTPSVDEFTQTLVHSLDAERVVIERARRNSKAEKLARAGTAYILAESGERGNRDEASIARHISWAESTMRVLGMLTDAQPKRLSSPTIFTGVRYLLAPTNGLWRPSLPVQNSFKKGDMVGIFQKLHNRKSSTLRSPASGTPLWWKETLRAKKGDVLMAVGQ